MKSILQVTIGVLLFGCLGLCIAKVNTVYASEMPQDYEAVGIDQNIADDRFDEYEEVDEIIICPISKSSTYKWVDLKQWYKAMYYYYVTELHFYDMPYNYIYDEGESYITRKTKEKTDLQPILKNYTIGTSVIGITNLQDMETVEFQDFILQIADQYDLSIENLYVSDCVVSQENVEDTFVSFLEIANKRPASDVVEAFEALEIPNNIVRSYSAAVKEVVYEKKTDPDKNLKVTVTLENTGQYAWYEDLGIKLVTYNELEHESEHFISGVWISRAQAAQVSATVAPGTTYELTFEIKPGLFPGQYDESFALLDPKGNVLEGTFFKVEFETNDVGYTFVKVRENEYGILNVRSAPSTSAEKIAVVAPGDVFILVEQTQYWVKIKIDESREGWVAIGFVDILN